MKLIVNILSGLLIVLNVIIAQVRPAITPLSVHETETIKIHELANFSNITFNNML